MDRLADLVAELQPALVVCRRAPALIGALALAAHGVVRTTDDVDLLVDSDDEPLVHAALRTLGYACTRHSSEAGSFRRGEDSVHLMHAHRPLARRLLAEAELRQTPVGPCRVISAEGLIACKLQGWVNNPARQPDIDDIRSLLVVKAGQLDMAEVRGYFELFDMEPFLEALMAGIPG